MSQESNPDESRALALPDLQQMEKGSFSVAPQPACRAESDIVDWEGPEDPRNPMNWPTWRKTGVLTAVCLIRFVTPLASCMMAPAILDIQRDLHSANDTLATFVISAFLIGFGIGPLFLAPLSELYGRSIIYHVGNVLFVVFTIGCALSPNMGALLAFRVLSGIVGGAPLTNGGGTIGDIIPARRRGAIMAIFSAAAFIAPGLGPVIGGCLSQSIGWRWIFWVLAIFSGAITILSFLFLQETYGPVVLARKARKLRKQTGNLSLYPRDQQELPLLVLLSRTIVRPLRMLCLSPIVLGLSLYTAMVYGYVYILFTTLSIVFYDQYGFSEQFGGLAYLGFGVGIIIPIPFAGYLSDAWYKKLTERHKDERPEFRLPLLIYGSGALPAGFFIYGWAAALKVHWIVPILGATFVGMGWTLSMVPIQSYLVDTFTIHSASAMAANSVIGNIAGGVLPLAGPALYARLGLGWGNSLLGFTSLAFGALPIALYIYGERLRKRYNIDFT